MAQVSIDLEQEQRQSLTQTVWALVGAGFAVPQLVDRTVASEVLDLLWFEAPFAGFCIWCLLLVQVVAIVLLATLFASLVILVTQLVSIRRHH